MWHLAWVITLVNNTQNKTWGDDCTLHLQYTGSATGQCIFWIWNHCTACPVVDINPTVMQACSRSGQLCIQGKVSLATHEQANIWCKVRKHAMWKSRWETYLKLCRTTWDRKWDSQLMVLLSNPLPGYYLQHCCPWRHIVWIIMQIFQNARPFMYT